MTEPVSHQRARSLLESKWGYPDFRPGQWEVIEPAASGRDVLAILPTGGGKSICYQVAGLLRGGLTLVVSPLIALMQDQVAGLRARGIEAQYVASTLSYRKVDQVLNDAEHGRYRFLYVSPERLKTDLFQARMERLDVRLLAVDEAHCVSEWGHHFRPAYREIAEAREAMGDPPTLAVTATATPEVRRDVKEMLALREPETLVQGFDRPNVVWSVFQTDQKQAQVRDVLAGVPGCSLLYASTRRATEQWASWLRSEGVRAAAYHAGMAPAERERVQVQWLEDELRIVAATNAFGMGIDKPDVRSVIHVDVPGSLEAYYQEAGRAGRDGGRSYAVLLAGAGDEKTQRSLIERSHPKPRLVRAVYDAVCNLAQLPIGSEADGPVGVDLNLVADVAKADFGLVRTAIELLERQETWRVQQIDRGRLLMRFLKPVDQVRRYAERLDNRRLSSFMLDLLRAVHADAYGTWWDMEVTLLERRTGLERERLFRGLDFLAERELLDWRAPETSMLVWLAEPRARRLQIDSEGVRRSRRQSEQRLEAMLRYVGTTRCRRHHLLSYFGEKVEARCGSCDVCLGRHDPDVITPEDEAALRVVLEGIADGERPAEWAVEAPQRRVRVLLSWLLQRGLVHATEPVEERYALTEKGRQYLEQ